MPFLWLLALAPLPYVAPGPLPPQPLKTGPLPSLQLGLPGEVASPYLDNGHIRVAHLILETPRRDGPALLAQAQEAVRKAFLRMDLAEVDVSLYPAPYQGPAGPLPLFTASVPKRDLPRFLALKAPQGYERLWLNPDPTPPGHPPSLEGEKELSFEGPRAFYGKERAEQLLASRLGRRAPALYHGDPRRPFAALTFDDSPHPLFTPLLLDTLHRLGLKATFFVIGRNAEAYPYFVQDLVRAGHELGNHTYSHTRLPRLSEAEIRQEIALCNEVLARITGLAPLYFRPPGGRYDQRVLRIARELGLTTVFWTDDPGDYAGLPTEALEARLMNRLRPGGIILLHDNVPATLEVLPAFAGLAQKKGLALGPVGALPLARR